MYNKEMGIAFSYNLQEKQKYRLQSVSYSLKMLLKNNQSPICI